jgi:peptidoglycan/LPS O-acetylase OafA/YrhL
MVGDASYSLYLSHLLPIVAVLFVARHAGIALAAASWGLLAASVLAAIAVAIVLHLAFERPVTRALRRLTAAARPNSPLDNRLVRS